MPGKSLYVPFLYVPLWRLSNSRSRMFVFLRIVGEKCCDGSYGFLAGHVVGAACEAHWKHGCGTRLFPACFIFRQLRCRGLVTEVIFVDCPA